MSKTPSTDFLPFGAQYFRSPTPLPESWEADLKNIRQHGFNTIKIWAQWRSNHPQKDVIDFSDLQRLMDLALQNDLKVDINLILDVSPVWLVREYPDSYMVFNDGTVLAPRTTEYRQIGGAPGPCYHHPQANHYKRLFVEKLAETFADHPALRVYDLWNEPELTCGLARQPSEEKMSCYCAHSQEAFRRWLKEKYHTIEALNQSWQRRYIDFSEVEAPRNPRSFNDMMDWRVFFSQSLTADLQLRIQAIRKYDTKTPIMVHTVPIPLFNMINSCADDYQMAKLCDGFGNSASSDPFSATLSVCAAKGKPVISAEIPALSGETFNHPNHVSYEDFKRHVFGPLSLGVKGFLFWQYRCELLGRESPAWGLTDLEGNETDYLRSAKRINKYLQENRRFILDAAPLPSQIAVIKDNYNEIFSWCANASTDKYFRSLHGAFYGFYDNNYNTDILTSDQLLDEDLSSYKLLYYPLPYYMSQPIADKLKAWVHAGGTLVSECFFGGYRAEVGLHSSQLPGYSFQEVFGSAGGVSVSSSVFVNAYGDSWSQESGSSLVSLNYQDRSGNTYNVPGYFFCEELIPQTATPLASFPDGRGAMTCHRFGKGQAILIGTLTGGGYDLTHAAESLLFFDDLARRAGVTRHANVSHSGVRVSTLEADGRLMVILMNNSHYAGPVRVDILSGRLSRGIMKNMDGGECCPVQSDESGCFFICSVQPSATTVLLSE